MSARHNPRAVRFGVLLVLSGVVGLVLLWRSLGDPGAGERSALGGEVPVAGPSAPDTPLAGAGDGPGRRADPDQAAGGIAIRAGGAPWRARAALRGRVLRALQRRRPCPGRGWSCSRCPRPARTSCSASIGRPKFDASWLRRMEGGGHRGHRTRRGLRLRRPVRNGSYFLEARSGWHAPDQTVLVRVDSDGAGGPVDVHVRAGGPRAGARLGGRRSGPCPVPWCSSTRAPPPLLAAARSGDFRLFTTRTERDGGFVFPGVPPGEGYDVTVSGRGVTISHRTGLTVVAGEDTPVEVRTTPPAVLRRAGAGPRARHRRGRTRRAPGGGPTWRSLPRGLRDLSFAAEVIEATHAVTGRRGALHPEERAPGRPGRGGGQAGLRARARASPCAWRRGPRSRPSR